MLKISYIKPLKTLNVANVQKIDWVWFEEIIVWNDQITTRTSSSSSLILECFHILLAHASTELCATHI